MKRTLCMLLALLMLFFVVLTACDNKGGNDGNGNAPGTGDGNNGGNGGDGGNNGGDDNGDGPTEIPESEWVTLGFLHRGDSDDIIGNGYPLFQLISKRTGVSINWDIYTTSAMYSEQIVARAAAGTLPDLYNVDNLATVNEYGRQGLAADLSDMYERPDIARYISEPNRSVFTDTETGKIYCVSQLRFDSKYINGFFYRDDILEEMGADIPVTSSEWYYAWQQVKMLYPNMVPLSAARPVDLRDRIYSTAFELYPVSGWFGATENGGRELVFLPTTDNWRSWITFFNRLNSEGILDKSVFQTGAEGTLGLGLNDWYTYVTSGKVFSGGNQSSDRISTWDKLAAENGLTIRCRMAMIMAGDEIGKAYVRNDPGIITTGNGQGTWRTSRQPICISTRSAYIEKAKDWIYYLFSDEFYDAYHFGFEGVDYTINSDGTYRWIRADEDNTSFQSSRVKTNGYPFYVARVVARQWAYPEVGLSTGYATDDDFIAHVEGDWQEFINPEPRLVAAYLKTDANDSEAITTRYDELSTALTNYANTQWEAFVSGVRPLSEWDLYVEQIRGLGESEALETARKWTDEWWRSYDEQQAK